VGYIERLRERRRQGERGAALVEFAILAPLLLLLLFGIIEFAWIFAQQVDLRSKTREATRLAIVDATTQEVWSRVCANDLVRSDGIVINRSGSDTVGQGVTVEITADIQQITGFFGWVWGTDPSMTSFTEGRVEVQTGTTGNFLNGTYTCGASDLE
jgi:hypothetical protein